MKSKVTEEEVKCFAEDVAFKIQQLYSMIEDACEGGEISDFDLSTIYWEIEEIDTFLEGYR